MALIDEVGKRLQERAIHFLKTLRVNGYDMAYVERGSGIPVILVHGTISDYRYWLPQIKPFGERFRVISVSLRHFYPERWNGQGHDFSLRQHAADLASFIEGLAAGRAHVVGHSRGGDVALVLASERQELLRSLVLAEPAPVYGLMPRTPEAETGWEKNRGAFSKALESLKNGDPEVAIKQFLTGVSGPGAWGKITERQKQIFLDNAWSLRSLLPDAQDPISCADVSRINVPILFVKGEKSARAYTLMMDGLQPCLKQFESFIVPNASHAMNQTDPQTFNAAVFDFFSRIAARQDGEQLP